MVCPGERRREGGCNQGEYAAKARWGSDTEGRLAYFTAGLWSGWRPREGARFAKALDGCSPWLERSPPASVGVAR
jgi:hypothetical protein